MSVRLRLRRELSRTLTPKPTDNKTLIHVYSIDIEVPVERSRQSLRTILQLLIRMIHQISERSFLSDSSAGSKFRQIPYAKHYMLPSTGLIKYDIIFSLLLK